MIALFPRRQSASPRKQFEDTDLTSVEFMANDVPYASLNAFNIPLIDVVSVSV